SVRLRPVYSADAAGARPAALFLKLCQSTFGRSELDYLTRDYAQVADAPIPRCYDAQIDEAIPAYHLLMDDLGATHHNNWQDSPSLAYAEALAEAVAALHAPYWQAQQRAALGGGEDAAPQFERYLAHSAQGLEHLLDAVQNDISAKHQQAIRSIFARHPAAVRARLGDPHGLTLIHGDLNPGNILSPHDGPRPVYLIDRQPFAWSLTTWYGVADLAYASVHWWPTEQRRAFEQPMLRRYHAALAERGITDYSWQQLWDDYRLMAMLSVYVAVEWCVLPADRAGMRWVWFPELEKALAAFDDLDCAALI
ncbi:MAG: phosphotransferase, partial [Roseiflexaceae bacterium]|nr:phosphotransferase [Roseiflexaceae bacterium]